MVFPFSMIDLDKDIVTVLCSNERGCGVDGYCPSCAEVARYFRSSLVYCSYQSYGFGVRSQSRASKGVDPWIWAWCLRKD